MHCISRTIQNTSSKIFAGGECRKGMFTQLRVSLRLGIQIVHRFPIQRHMSIDSPQTKRQKMVKVCYSSRFVIDDTQRCEKTIGTHNGTFHCDEALAVFLLRQTNAFRDAGKAIYTLEVRILTFH